MSREAAISRIMEYGTNKEEAIKQLNEMTDWYLRGTGRTAADKKYAEECAIEDILEEE